jgi:hypothetical protein
MKAPMAKLIIVKHKTSKDTHKIWKEVCEHYDSAMLTQIKVQEILKHSNGTKLAQINWRGSQQSFISDWQDFFANSILLQKTNAARECWLTCSTPLSTALKVWRTSSPIIAHQGKQLESQILSRFLLRNMSKD